MAMKCACQLYFARLKSVKRISNNDHHRSSSSSLAQLFKNVNLFNEIIGDKKEEYLYKLMKVDWQSRHKIQYKNHKENTETK